MIIPTQVRLAPRKIGAAQPTYTAGEVAKSISDSRDRDQVLVRSTSVSPSERTAAPVVGGEYFYVHRRGEEGNTPRRGEGEHTAAGRRGAHCRGEAGNIPDCLLPARKLGVVL